MTNQDKRIRKLEQSLEFYKRRVIEIQKYQSEIPDPHRQIICDILANGFRDKMIEKHRSLN